jgi:hypothetical protein
MMSIPTQSPTQALEAKWSLQKLADSPLIIKPPLPAAMADNSMAKTTPMPLNYQILSLAKVALLSMVSQRMIIVVFQSPAQVMSTAMRFTCT